MEVEGELVPIDRNASIVEDIIGEPTVDCGVSCVSGRNQTFI